MISRKIVTDKHRMVARLLLSGESFYRALLHCGYSRGSAKNPKLAFAHSWGLRQALVEAQRAALQCFRVPLVRRRRYDRRAVARFAVTHCNAAYDETATNKGVRDYVATEKRAARIAAGLPAFPIRCSLCRGLLEGNDHWCPNCGRIEIFGK